METLTTLFKYAVAGGVFAFVEFLINRYDKKQSNKHVLQNDCKERGKRYDQYFAADKKALQNLQDAVKIMTQAITVLLQNDTVQLEHMKTNNATNKIAERQDITDKFLADLIQRLSKQ